MKLFKMIKEVFLTRKLNKKLKKNKIEGMKLNVHIDDNGNLVIEIKETT